MSLFRPNIDAMTGYEPGEQLAGDYVKLNTNENPYPPSPRVLAALQKAIGPRLRLYPDPLATALREQAAKLYGVRPDMILCGNGSDDLLTIITRAFVGESDTIVSPQPSYLLYPVLAQIQGARFRAVAFPPDYSLPPDLAAAGGKVTFLANPNSPSGTFIPVDNIERLVRQIKGVLVVDEAYVDFADEDAMRLLPQFPNLIILRTLSKSYSLAGMRIGLAVAHEPLIEGMRKVKDSYNIDMLSTLAGAAALADQPYFRETVAKIRAERRFLSEQLRQMGLEVYPSQSNFVMARFRQPSAREVLDELKRRHVLVRHYNIPGVQDCLRISIGAHEQMERLAAELKSML